METKPCLDEEKKQTTEVLAENDSVRTRVLVEPPFEQTILESDGRETWDKKFEFLLAVIGFAVDLGNVWRFPYICYRNGGGAFLIPYVIMLLFGGLPLFYLELALGQYYRCGCLTLWNKICPLMKGIGYAICLIDLYMAMYYNTIISWAVYFLFASFTTELPWTRCDNPWNTDSCRTMQERGGLNYSNISVTSPSQEFFERSVLEMHRSEGIGDLGPIKWSLALCLLAVFVMVYFSLWKGVKSSGKVLLCKSITFSDLYLEQSNGTPKADVFLAPEGEDPQFAFLVGWFPGNEKARELGDTILSGFTPINAAFNVAVWVTATLPYVVLFILLIRGITLEGSLDGIKYYLYPQWDKLLESKVWIDAATQIFFSLGPGFGTLLALSSYNKFHNNCYRDAIITSSINCLTSFLAGFVIFSVLGYMARVLNKDIDKVATVGPGLVFVVYPEALATMKGSVFWSILFFLMLITLGLDSTFGGLEALITGLCDEYPSVLRRYREVFVAVLVLFIYLCSLPTATYGGNYLVALLDAYGTSMSLLFVVFVESVGVCWLYGAQRISEQIKEMLGTLPGIFWRVCWTYISPVFIFVMFVFAMVHYKDLELEDYVYPRWSIAIGWMLTSSAFSCIPLYIFYRLIRTPGTLYERIVKNLQPDDSVEAKEAIQERLPMNSCQACVV